MEKLQLLQNLLIDILNKIKNGQVLITCCEDQSISAKTGGKVITVNSGRIEEL